MRTRIARRVAHYSIKATSWIFPTCKRATRLQSDALVRKLGLRERFGLAAHLVFCKWCRIYRRQTLFLRKFIRSYALKTDPVTKETLSPQAREQIRAALRKIE